MIKIAIMGFGVVGSGVYEVIEKNAHTIAQKAAQEIEVKYILDLRDFKDSPFADKFVKDFSVIENDPEVRVVVETMGGLGAAYEFTKRCLLKDKHVVTSNKELVATHGAELLKIANERNLNYLFEASVGGGIPIIRPMVQCLAANELETITGILNGTTNYILTRMIRAGLSFEDALKEAQQKGYAEKNPTADVEGQDACRKICILASLAFGDHVYPQFVETEGITKITLKDVDYAAKLDCVVKLLGRAVRDKDGKIYAFVAPHFVSKENPLAGVDDVFNAIMVCGNAIGDVMFYGRGAGKLPTASAVVADVIDAVKHLHARRYLDWGMGEHTIVKSPDAFASRYYVRFGGANAAASLKKELNVESLIELDDQPVGEAAAVVASTETKNMKNALVKLAEQGTVLGCMRIL